MSDEIERLRAEVVSLRATVASYKDAIAKSSIFGTELERISDEETIVWIQEHPLPDKYAGKLVVIVPYDELPE